MTRGQFIPEDLKQKILQAKGSGSTREIGNRFNVSNSTVVMIWNGTHGRSSKSCNNPIINSSKDLEDYCPITGFKIDRARNVKK